LFTRALGYVKPRDIDSDLLDITYVGNQLSMVYVRAAIQTVLFTTALIEFCMSSLPQVTVSDPDIHAAVEGHISELCSQVERRPPSDVVQVRVQQHQGH
jgi:hypothetical protein